MPAPNPRRLCLSLIALLAAMWCEAARPDTIGAASRLPLRWSVGAEASPLWVIPTNGFLKGDNPAEKRVRSGFSGSLRVGFRFNENSDEGILYPGLYQGIGIGGMGFSPASLLGSPVTAYVYQGLPIARFGTRLSLAYEWKFGAAIGWKHRNYDEEMYNDPVSTRLTAMMAVGLKLQYAASDRFTLSAGVEAVHFSNGNTSLPNAGVNAALASVGVAYSLAPHKPATRAGRSVLAEADRRSWIFDIMAYGAWRRRVVEVGDPVAPQMCPGKFGVAGMQLAPMRVFSRWLAAGPSLDLQWDESAGLEPYWVEGTSDKDIKFRRPPFGKQLKAGISAHAELTMPIFHINAGIGYDFVTPCGDRRFYQSLALKTFISRSLYINIGYRLADFSEPENLMLGLGFRL